MSVQLSRVQAAILFHLLPRVGPAAYWQLRETLGANLEQLWQLDAKRIGQLFPSEALPLLTEFRSKQADSALYQRIERIQERCFSSGIETLAFDDVAYPKLLSEIAKPPPLLFIRGDASTLSSPQLAIVGSRKPSPQGKQNARNFARILAQGGLSITSGLALGVDALAHRGALDAEGKTVAVLACGLDQIYPLRHTALAEDILDKGGAIISEFLPGTKALREHFPQRNRIISGLSYGTLVVEAAVKSGSLISARYALQQNREVFAIPGSIHNPLARGCHALIKDGASLVESPEDVANELGGFLSWHQQIQPEAARQDVNEIERKVLDALGFDGAPCDHLVDTTGFSVAELSSALLSLEMKELVEEIAGVYMRRMA
jgi:DNA processing protein